MIIGMSAFAMSLASAVGDERLLFFSVDIFVTIPRLFKD